MKPPLSQAVVKKLENIRGNVAIPMTDQQGEELHPILLMRIAQTGDPDGNFAPCDEFVADHRIGLYTCDYGVVLYLIFAVGKQPRKVCARFDLSLIQAIEWLRLLCCVDSVLVGIVDQELESLVAFELAWPERTRLVLNQTISDGLRYLANIPSDMRDEIKVANAFSLYEATHVEHQ